MNYKLLLGFTVGISAAFPAFLEKRYLRFKRGLNKIKHSYMANSTLNETFEVSDTMQIYRATMMDFLQQRFDRPFALVFVQRIETVQKILQIAQKYNLTIGNFDIENLESGVEDNNIPIDLDDGSLNHHQRPMVVLNTKEINHLSFDQISGILQSGVGNRVSDINSQLKQYGRRLTLDSQERLFTIMQQSTELNNSIIGIEAVLPNGMAITTPPQDIKNGGVDFSSFLLGQQGKFGVPISVRMTTEEISTLYKSRVSLSKPYMSKTNLYYILQALNKQLSNYKDAYLNYSQNSSDLEIITQTQMNLKSTLDQYVNSYVYREFWNNEENQSINHYPIQLSYQMSAESLNECLLQLNQLNLSEDYTLRLNLKTNTLDIFLQGTEKTVVIARQITSYVNSRKGRFNYSNNPLLGKLLKQESVYIENGVNHLYLEQQVNKLIDPKLVMFGLRIPVSYE